MPISTLRINDFRNLASVELLPCSGFNIICGNNGSGKTSLLEAIHYLSVGKSFRNPASTGLIRQTTEKFSVFAQLVSEQSRHVPVGVERHKNGSTRLRMAEQDISGIAELAACLPIRIINSQSHLLFESGPSYRRKYLDWGLFYQTESFLSCWRQFERSLKQRNAALRDKRPKREFEVWTEELVKHGLVLDKLRRDYVQSITPLLVELAQELLTISDLQINYLPGWDETQDYAAMMTDSFSEELRFGYTLYGPHRADLEVTINSVPVKHFLSRGQQKLLICAMIVAQGVLLASQVNKGLVYLIDDLPAELDFNSRGKLISLLSRQETQIFITAIESETIIEVVDNKSTIPMKVFHVEHGSLKTEERR